MKLTISPVIFKSYPELNVGIVIAKNIDNTGSDEKIYHLIKEVQEYIKLNFVPEKISQHPLISPWRAAYSEFGAKPSTYHSSVEALMKRILKGDDIPRVNKIVDIYNYVSLKHLIPMGADDLDNVDTEIILTKARGSEIFVPLGSDDIEHPEQGEVIYKDQRKVLCRRWNWRGSETSKITEKTKNCIIYIEGLPPITKEKLELACKETVKLINMFCQRESEFHILDKGNSELKF